MQELMHFQLEQGPKIGFVVSTGPRGHIHLAIPRIDPLLNTVAEAFQKAFEASARFKIAANLS